MSDFEHVLRGAIGAFAAQPSERSERHVLELISMIPPQERGIADQAMLQALREQSALLEGATSPPLRTAVVWRPEFYTPNGRSPGDHSPGADTNGGRNDGANGRAPLALVRMLPGGAHALCAVAPGLALEIGDLVAVSGDGAILDSVARYQGGDIGTVVRLKPDTGELVVRGLNDDELVVLATRTVLDDPQLKTGSKVRYGRATEIATLVEESVDARSDAVADQIPDLDWSDVGGMREVKRKFARIEARLLSPREDLDRYRLNRVALTLLTGPPGCGKTYTAKCLISSLRRRLGEDEVVFIVRRAADDLSPLVGVTEARIRGHFERARALAEQGRIVAFIYDEFEGLFPHRGTRPFSTMVENTLTDVLLGELCGMSELSNFVMFALTNRPDMIDSAILRDGRLGDEIVFERPNWPESEEIFRIHLRDRPCADGVSIGELAERAAARVFTPQRNGTDSPPVAIARFRDGKTEAITRASLVTGALIQAACDAAAETAWLRGTDGGPDGIGVHDVLSAVDAAFAKFPTRMRDTNISQYTDWPRDKAELVVAVERPAQSHASGEPVFVEAA